MVLYSPVGHFYVTSVKVSSPGLMLALNRWVFFSFYLSPVWQFKESCIEIQEVYSNCEDVDASGTTGIS